ncbi:hypothetical protein GCM10027168_00140 [Streptomyces capparidis]
MSAHRGPRRRARRLIRSAALGPLLAAALLGAAGPAVGAAPAVFHAPAPAADAPRGGVRPEEPGRRPGGPAQGPAPASRTLPRGGTADLLPLGTGLTLVGLGAALLGIRLRQS